MAIGKTVAIIRDSSFGCFDETGPSIEKSWDLVAQSWANSCQFFFPPVRNVSSTVRYRDIYSRVRARKSEHRTAKNISNDKKFLAYVQRRVFRSSFFLRIVNSVNSLKFLGARSIRLGSRGKLVERNSVASNHIFPTIGKCLVRET